MSDATTVRIRERRIEALAQRLSVASAAYLSEVPELPGDPGDRIGELLDLMIREVGRRRELSGTWLLLTAVRAAFPTSEEVRAMMRRITLSGPDDAAVALLDLCRSSERNAESIELEMDLVEDAVLASVDYCARVEHHTGIQRVVRETMPRWDRDHRVIPVAWTDAGSIMRDLDDIESDRVLRWSEQRHLNREAADITHRLIVPWHSNVVMIEVPLPQITDALLGLAEHSGNEVTAVGYDAIPIVSADIRPFTEADNYVRYLAILKHTRRISGISTSAAQEFEGYAQAMPVQGLRPATVTECFLPGEAPHATEEPAETDAPLVLSVGSQEEHKNHLALVYASEVLWREGLEFSVELIGRPGWQAEHLAERVEGLQAIGRPIRFRRGVFDQELWNSYRRARFTVFPSLHEGYGLPVAESLACGTPVITTNFGSLQEIAEGGGTLTIDPRDDQQLVDAMRVMLTDDELWQRLRTEAAQRPVRTWDDYAAELWEQLTGSEEDEG